LPTSAVEVGYSRRLDSQDHPYAQRAQADQRDTRALARGFELSWMLSAPIRGVTIHDHGSLTAGTPTGHTGSVVGEPRFVVQLHDATTLHFDFRLQSGEVLRSWAVPKGPSLDPVVRRLAVPVDDHSLSAGEFEGVHEGQRRGTGAVIIWDEGTAEVLKDEPGHVSFILHGRKLSGGFALTRTGQKRWILVKVRDEEARPGSDIVAERPESVRSGKTWQELQDP
jgi:DNA ligase D-like protein (predicted 3'-phosphoesterase)